MTQFQKKSFSVAALATKEYRDNWDRIFGKDTAVEPVKQHTGESCQPLVATVVVRKPRRSTLWEAFVSPEEFANHLVDNVACATQLDPNKGELPNADDWRYNAAKLYSHMRMLNAPMRKILRHYADLVEGQDPNLASDIRALCDQHDNDTDATNNSTDRNTGTTRKHHGQHQAVRRLHPRRAPRGRQRGA